MEQDPRQELLALDSQYLSPYSGSSIRDTEPSGILASIVGSRKSPWYIADYGNSYT